MKLSDEATARPGRGGRPGERTGPLRGGREPGARSPTSFARATPWRASSSRASSRRRRRRRGDAAPELGAYLCALAPLLGRTELAIDAGTGDGGLLEVLAPVYGRVVAVDRSEAQLALARARGAGARRATNVELVHGELDGDAVRARSAARGRRRRLRRAPAAPRRRAGRSSSSRSSPTCCRPAGRSWSSTTRHHDDESMRAQADLWLGFEPRSSARSRAKRASTKRASLPSRGALCGRGPDAHLPWQAMVRARSARAPQVTKRSANEHSPERGNDHGNG